MKKLYLIIPLVFTAAFLVVFFQYQKEAEAAAEIKRVQLEKEAAEELAKKIEAEKVAQKEAAERNAKRIADERKREEERQAKWDAEMKQITDDTAKYAAQVAEYNADIQKTTDAITAARAEKEKLTRSTLQFAQQVEQVRVQRRITDLEIQRLVEMIAQRSANATIGNPLMPAATK